VWHDEWGAPVMCDEKCGTHFLAAMCSLICLMSATSSTLPRDILLCSCDRAGRPVGTVSSRKVCGEVLQGAPASREH
jgi:hypothetical protein